MLRLGLPCTALILTGCASTQTARVDPVLVKQVTSAAAAQVKRCYRAPKVLGEGKRIATRLHVRYAPDGSLIGIPQVVAQMGVTPSNQLFADEMAEAAIASVVRCAPLKLPAELYQLGWNSFELTFSPALRG